MPITFARKICNQNNFDWYTVQFYFISRVYLQWVTLLAISKIAHIDHLLLQARVKNNAN